jgi:hypothetical protein
MINHCMIELCALYSTVLLNLYINASIERCTISTRYICTVQKSCTTAPIEYCTLVHSTFVHLYSTIEHI